MSNWLGALRHVGDEGTGSIVSPGLLFDDSDKRRWVFGVVMEGRRSRAVIGNANELLLRRKLDVVNEALLLEVCVVW